MCWLDRLAGHVPNLLDQELSLVNELLILGPVLQEVRQEVQQLVPVVEQNPLHGDRLVRVGNKDLEHVEAFVLDHLPLVPEEVHANLQVLSIVNIQSHNRIIGAVQQDLAEKLDRLALGDIAARLDQYFVVLLEEQVEVRGQILCHNLFMFGQYILFQSAMAHRPDAITYSERREGICSNLE